MVKKIDEGAGTIALKPGLAKGLGRDDEDLPREGSRDAEYREREIIWAWRGPDAWTCLSRRP
jgi:hypothetical protein